MSLQTKKNKGVLIIVPTFSPNVGGVETHMDDLVRLLNEKRFNIYVHTYSPITTPGVSWKPKEQWDNVHIWRYRWFGKTLLHRLETKPLLHFLYLTPYLLVRTLVFMLFNRAKIDLIHAQGFNAAFIGGILKKLFKKPLIVSTHALYDIKPNSRNAERIRGIISGADAVLTLARTSHEELVSFGIDAQKIREYRYWIDLETFKPFKDKAGLKERLGITGDFIVLFVGRLTEIKGVRELAAAASMLPQMNFVFIGTGPLEGFLMEKSAQEKNIQFLGRKTGQDLVSAYNAAHILCIPSQYREGFGRVVMEALACGIPVVASNKGALTLALDESVAILVDPTAENLKNALSKLQADKRLYSQLQQNSRLYAERFFSEKNAEAILDTYRIF